jgi:phosphatidylglycerophosphate synthase
MIDHRLRLTKDRVIDPVAAMVPAAVTPTGLSAVAVVGGVGAGVLAATGWRWWSLVVWLASRVVDGVDGALARRRGAQSDLGGYLDLLGDTVSYAAVPLGIAVAADEVAVWAACAGLLASFYVNSMSWTLLAAVAEKRGAGAASRGERTTLHMPAGLVEGAETIVLFSLMLALPDAAQVLFWGMAVLVGITIVQRVVWARRSLR